MRIERAEIFLLRLPLSQSFNYHKVSRNYTDNIVLRVQSDGLDGYGEAVPRTYVTGESAQSAFEELSSMLPNLVAGMDFGSPDQVKEYLWEMSAGSVCQASPSAFCAFELATFDLSSRYWGLSLETIFQTTWTQPPPYSAVVPLLPPEGFEAFVEVLRQNDMRHVKIKVDAQVDPAFLERATFLLGEDVDLRVDANGAWEEKEAVETIALMERFGINAVEQPVAKENVEGLKRVTSQVKAMIIADESVCTLDDARRLSEMTACDAFNIRLSKCGGFVNSLAILTKAKETGLKYQVGCQVGETGILSAAARHLAGWLDDILYLEGSFGNWVLREDIVEEDVRFGRGGYAPPLPGNGLGIHVCRDAIDRYTLRSETLRF